ncbi:hypothetical protein QBC35DRAFT_196930 [Podospora australis]|uniref:Uncharacterized protein n=1 Tax=Podospora australis TaxID=1536484 RepID=A0AAN7AL11_9PEZI|nr:hypothetical protein QBC35DRAFT_196930 [Podospora australis]
MPRFPVTFGRRKSTADSLENAAVTGPSFRVLERTEVAGVKSFDGGVRSAAKTHAMHKSTASEITVDDNIFADLKPNRGSGSSNTTKTVSTETSSRHSNASTAPSSADMGPLEDWKQGRKPHAGIPVPPIPKSSSAGFLKAAGRTFSFGGQKKQLPSSPEEQESRPSSPIASEVPVAQTPVNGRSRATTTSTTTTVTPPRVDGDFNLDLGGDFAKMMLGNEKRAIVATVKEDQKGRQALAPRSLTASRLNQPSPLQIDMTTKVDPSPYSWSSQHSNEQLIAPPSPSPPVKENIPHPVLRHSSPLAERQLTTSPETGPKKRLLVSKTPTPEQEDGEDEEARLLRDSLSTVTKFITGSVAASNQPSTSRYRRNEDDDSLFDTSHSYSAKSANRFTATTTSPPPVNKVMTPAEFEKYRKDKERQDKERQADVVGIRGKSDEDEEDNYEDDEDDLEKAKQQTKQRRKQEAHMAVYRQQMMKVTGESGNPPSSRPSLQISFSTPNLPNLSSVPAAGIQNNSEPSDEDEEIPLAILAAHGFPNRNRPPTRLSTMASNPNLRASQQPSFQRPVSVVGDASGPGGGRLPAFARNLPQDPFLGAGLVRNSVRESFALGAGAGVHGQPGGAIPPGGLIGVIANEERSRAMRRGSPHIDSSVSMPSMPGAAAFDPIAGIPSHLMYQPNPSPPALTPGDQAQIQMTQQMQQFMQMQMQFMQMMAGQNGSAPSTPNGHMSAQSVGHLPHMGVHPGAGSLPVHPMAGMAGTPEMRHSFLGTNDSMLDLPVGRGGEAQMRTMSMVQPSSASWIQPMPHPGFAPSIRVQGGGYTPSIAPSERSNIGLPGRYRPVSHLPAPHVPVAPGHLRKSTTMSGAIPQPIISVTKSGNSSDDDDDEEGWAAMKAKREQKKSTWKSKKSSTGDFGSFMS